MALPNSPCCSSSCFGKTSDLKPDLVLQRVVSAIEPEPPLRSAVDTEGAADGIAKLSLLQLIVLWKDFDPFHESGPFDRNLQLQSKVVDINPAFPCQQGSLEEDPEVAAALAH